MSFSELLINFSLLSLREMQICSTRIAGQGMFGKPLLCPVIGFRNVSPGILTSEMPRICSHSIYGVPISPWESCTISQHQGVQWFALSFFSWVLRVAVPYISKVTGLALTSCMTMDKWVHLSEPYLFIFKMWGLNWTMSKCRSHLSLLSFWQQPGILLYEYRENHLTSFSHCHYCCSQEQILCVGRLKNSVASSFM